MIQGVPSAAPAKTAFLRRLTRAQRRQRLRVAFEAMLVAAAAVGGASAWAPRGALVGGLLVFTFAALWVWLPRGTLHAVAATFDQAIANAGGGVRDDRVLCAYELIDADSPLAQLVLQQGQQAASRVPLRVVATLLPRPYALALAGFLGLVTLLPWVKPHKREPVVASGATVHGNGTESVTPPHDVPSKRQYVADVVAQAFKASPPLQAVGEAVATRNAMALAAATAELQKTLPTEASDVAAGLAIAKHALVQQHHDEAIAPPQTIAEGASESDESQTSSAMPDASEDERTLERLERGLDEAEDICARDPQACADAVANVNQQLQPLAANEAGGESEAKAEARPQAEPKSAGAAPTETQSAPPSVQGASPNQQTSTTPGSSQKDQQARHAAAAIAGVATQDVAVDLGAVKPDGAELVQAAREHTQTQRFKQVRFNRYRQQAEAVVANQALPQDRRAIVRTYFQSLRPEQLAGGATRD